MSMKNVEKRWATFLILVHVSMVDTTGSNAEEYKYSTNYDQQDWTYFFDILIQFQKIEYKI